MNCMEYESDNIKKKLMIDSIRNSMGNVTEACKKADIARNTHYRWLRDDPNYAQAVEDVMEERLDFAESKLLENIKGNDTTSIIFFLKTQGKGRGYVERSQVETKNVTQFSEMSDDELNEFIESNTSGSGE